MPWFWSWSKRWYGWKDWWHESSDEEDAQEKGKGQGNGKKGGLKQSQGRRSSNRRISQSSSRHWRTTPSPCQGLETEPEEDEDQQGLEKQPMDPCPFFQESRGKARNARKRKRANDPEIQSRKAKGQKRCFLSSKCQRRLPQAPKGGGG